MQSASSNLAPGTRAWVAQMAEAHRPSTSNYRSKLNNQVDASNRPGEGERSSDGGSIPLGASKIMAPWSNGKTLRHLN
jgi:hypothetical protein